MAEEKDKEKEGTPSLPASSGTAIEDAMTPNQDSNPNPKPERKSMGARVKAVWAKAELDTRTLLSMAKGGIPPVLALSLFELDYISELWPTLGYLLGIIAVLGMCIMPRAKFIENMFLDVVATCVGIAFALLVSYCSVRARANTPSSPPTPGARAAPYNSSASVISAVWLFFQIYAVNTIRAKLPRYTFPIILYCIITIISCVYSPRFETEAQAIAFCKEILEVFLFGLACATVVHFLVFPVSSRQIVFHEFTAYLGGFRRALKAELAYFTSLEDPETFKKTFAATNNDKVEQTAQSKAVKGAVAALAGLHGKLSGDLVYAKREVAFGNLGPEHLKQMFEQCRIIMLPTIGLSAVIDIFEHVNDMERFDQVPGEEKTFDGFASLVDELGEEEVRRLIIHDWTEYMRVLRPNMTSIFGIIDEALEHTLLTLRLQKPAKAQKGSKQPRRKDVEDGAQDTRPGSKGFADHFEKELDRFHSGKEIALRTWCEHKGIHLPHDFFEHPAASINETFVVGRDESYASHARRQRQLYLLLYMEYLMNAVGRSVLQFVRFADDCEANGYFARKKIILPGTKRMKKWIKSIIRPTDLSNEDESSPATDIGGNTQTVELGSAYNKRKDPEHLPPTTALEKLGNYVRLIPAVLKSPESAHGFRVATATISLGIVAFVHQTQEWFVRQRGIWALIMVAISMNPTAGSSIYSYAIRVIGTTLAMLIAWVVWYITDEHTAGILVFLWVAVSFAVYIPLKKPQFAVIGILGMVTMTMIIGYQLEERKVGRAKATSNDQPYYRILVFAPYRLLTVLTGLAASFVWTIFPYPISEHSQIRKGLGGSLYLLANYYSVVHELVRARIKDNMGDPKDKKSPGAQLKKHRTKIFSKLMLSLTGLRTYAHFLKYEIPVGGKFPRKEYETIIERTASLMNFMSLISYASRSFAEEEEKGSKWSADFRAVIDSAVFTSREITTLLSLLSAAIANGNPLPPYLRAPQPYMLSQRLEALDKDILSIRHINEPCYAAFAVIQISTRCMIADLNKLLANVKVLVGELDFSFHVISTLETDSEDELTTWETARTRDLAVARTRTRKED